MKLASFCVICTFAPWMAGSSVLAADTAIPATPSSSASRPSATAPDKLKTARALIADRKWDAAISELKGINDSGSADWNNLMGYCLRKSGKPDYAAAEKYYEQALRIDPAHRGALEYSGELYLMTGDLPRAEERLARLDKACVLPCEEYTDLKKAVARYKAAGNKYVAEP
jgi:tetratricopeptide (TPR) repeat protein